MDAELEESVDSAATWDPDASAVAARMLLKPMDTAVQRTGCEALRILARGDSTNRRAVLTAGGPEAIVGAMKRLSDDPHLMRVCCAALASIATGSDESKKALIDRGALPALVTIMDLHAGDVGVLLNGCDVLRSVSSSDNSRKAALLAPSGSLGAQWSPAPAASMVHCEVLVKAMLAKIASIPGPRAAPITAPIVFTRAEFDELCELEARDSSSQLQALRPISCVKVNCPGALRFLAPVAAAGLGAVFAAAADAPAEAEEGAPATSGELLGLEWEDVGPAVPEGRTERVNAALSAALRHNSDFTASELDGFGLERPLAATEVVRSYGPSLVRYFKPVPDGPLGLKWMEVGAPSQPAGYPMNNVALARAVQAKVFGKTAPSDDHRLFWRDTTETDGKMQIVNAQLEDALRHKHFFSEKEFDEFRVLDWQASSSPPIALWVESFIQVDDTYYEPDVGLQPEAVCRFDAADLIALGVTPGQVTHNCFVKTWAPSDERYFKVQMERGHIGRRWKEVTRREIKTRDVEIFSGAMQKALQTQTEFTDAELRSLVGSQIAQDLRPDTIVTTCWPGTEQYFTPASGLAVVVAAMARYATETEVSLKGPMVQLKGCGVLRNIALGDDTCKQAVVTAGGLAALMTALRLPSAELGATVFRAVANLSYGADAIKHAVVGAGAHVGVIRAMKAHPADAELLVEAGAAEAIVAAMEQQYGHRTHQMKVLRSGCAALEALALGEGEGAKQAVVRAGGLQAVKSAMQQTRDDVVIKGRGAGTLGCVASGSSSLKQAVVDKAGKEWFKQPIAPLTWAFRSSSSKGDKGFNVLGMGGAE